MSLRQVTITGLSAIALAVGGAGNATANANLVVNGDFSAAVPNIGLLAGNSNPTSWTYAGGYAFVYGFGAADTIGGFAGGTVYLWGPGNPPPGPNKLNGLTASSCPTCGNYLASDSDSKSPGYSGAFSQLITGLTPGDSYILNFDYAAAQFRDSTGSEWNGMTASEWDVTFAGVTQYTPVLQIGDHGFSGWVNQTFTYTVPSNSNGSEILSFLAASTIGFGLPPVALLDNVRLAVPEPASLSLMGVGLLSLFGVGHRRRAKSATA